MIDYVTVLGSLAGALTTVAFFPQLLKVWRTRSTRDISLGMFSIFCVGVLVWFVYGILIDDAPVIIANFLVFVQALIIVAFKVRYK
jgi:MtN3 and saliva related transmembrane protein